MVKNLLALIWLIFLASCNGQQTTDTSKGAAELQVANEKIKSFLRQKNFELVTAARSVVVFDITKHLIEGTTDEYSNKLKLKDTLTDPQVTELLALLVDDSSYDWSDTEGTQDFDPRLQLLVGNDTGRIFLLVDKDRRRLGFINLEGQRIVGLSENLIAFFDQL